MVTWMIAARAAIGHTSYRISQQTVSSAANQTSKLIKRRGLASGVDHHMPPKVDLKQEAKDKKKADYILYTGLVKYLDEEVPS
ncbi:hypothetical protein MKX01_000698 [Papaver californicum]|nr:hypothetical protein MKX01_000698 [Papaver californicum]